MRIVVSCLGVNGVRLFDTVFEEVRTIGAVGNLLHGGVLMRSLIVGMVVVFVAGVAQAQVYRGATCSNGSCQSAGLFQGGNLFQGGILSHSGFGGAVCSNGVCGGQPVQSWGQPVQSWGQPVQSWGQPVQSWGQPVQSWGQPVQSSPCYSTTPVQPQVFNQPAQAMPTIVQAASMQTVTIQGQQIKSGVYVVEAGVQPGVYTFRSFVVPTQSK